MMIFGIHVGWMGRKRRQALMRARRSATLLRGVLEVVPEMSLTRSTARRLEDDVIGICRWLGVEKGAA